MTKPVNSRLYLDGNEVETSHQLVETYRKRIKEFGMSGKTMFYLNEVQHQTKIAQFATLLHDLVSPGDSLLDVGCGYGDLAALLPNCRYTGIDLVPEFIAHASQRHSLLEFKILDLAECQDTYDWTVLLGVVNSTPRPERLVELAWSRCRKGMMVDFIDKTKLTGDRDNLNRFDVGSCLAELLGLGAQKIEVYSTANVWTIFVPTRPGKWLRSRI